MSRMITNSSETFITEENETLAYTHTHIHKVYMLTEKICLS